MPPQPPSVFSPAQISQYLSYLRFPPALLSGPRDISFLRALHALHIASLPYENLALHYSPSHTNTLAPAALFTKAITAAAGRGGYCLELATLYLQLLRGVGFAAYPSMARIRLRRGTTPHGPFVGYVHVTVVVVLDDGTRWSCDVGFGGDGPTVPLLMGEGGDVANLGAQRVRLGRGVFDGRGEGGGEVQVEELAVGADTGVPKVAQGIMLGNGMEGERVWFYQYRNGDEGPWNTNYAFTGEPADERTELEDVNRWTSTAPSSFQRGTVLVVKFVLSEVGLARLGIDVGNLQRDGGAPWVVHPGDEAGSAADGLIAGKIMLVDGVVKRNLGGRTEVLRVCETEEDRVQALKEFFGIELTDEQTTGIKGFATELRRHA